VGVGKIKKIVMAKQREIERQKEVIVTVSPSVLVLVLIVITVGSFLTYRITSSASNGVGAGAQGDKSGSEAVTEKDGKQIITVLARGGYSPRTITAKAGIPTTLVMKTENSYGCERAFRIPKMGIAQTLPETGLTEIDLGTQAAGARVSGTCSMGMYSVSINFN